MADTKNIETKVEKVDVDLSEIFNGAPGADSVALPEEETKQTNIFSRKKDVDVSFIDKKVESKEETTTEESTDNASETTEEVKQETKKEVVSKEQIDEILGDNIEEETEKVEEPKKTRGRKPIDGVGDVFKKLIEDEKLFAFDDEKELEDYSAKDLQELIQANLDERTRAVRQETPKQFFDSLPQELQIAARYVADGGTDLKGMFGALAQVEEHRALDIKKGTDQERIIREYLGATGFGNAEEIQEEIEVWKDLGKLEQQAMKFKPKLDKMQEKVVAQKLKQQDMVKKQKEQASKNYMQNVYNSLKDGKVGNIKVDKKTQSFIYNGLVNPAYPSISGQNTNLLGHLLEKYQFTEPNYPLVTEALWLLADPKGYKNNIMKLGANKAVENTVRKLKTAQSSKRSAGAIQEEQPTKRPSRKLPRNKSNNIFKRI
jgi:hypothetical protein